MKFYVAPLEGVTGYIYRNALEKYFPGANCYFTPFIVPDQKHPLRKKFPPFAGYKVIESGEFYGEGYQDVQHRKPSIKNAWKYSDWKPVVKLEDSIEMTLDFFLKQAVESGEFGVK